MTEDEKIINSALAQIQKITKITPRVSIVLGSGLGEFAQKVDVESEIAYDELDGFPKSTVKGHSGKFIFARVNDIPLVIMQGRIHYYEGYSMDEAVLPIRFMAKMNAKTLILTNAAGAVNPNFEAGELMMISDHISAFVPSPLRSEFAAENGERFPDMSEVYSKRIRNIIRNAAQKTSVKIHEGVYAQWQGPNYETPAEIKMFSILGADAVGMSTASEAIAARHMGMEVGGISCLTNMAAGILEKKLSHDEVQKVAKESQQKFEELMLEVIKNL